MRKNVTQSHTIEDQKNSAYYYITSLLVWLLSILKSYTSVDYDE